jgi:hypothetical protein
MNAFPVAPDGVKAYGGNRFRIAAIAVNPRVGPCAKSIGSRKLPGKAQSGGINLPP